ncbi:hypothetical protein M8C21_005969 [Ambrosia artemisiifolia]|uniref:Uncharacterized protein n=1 Tax=Ambrosia artemisiifolia TaxID=4212 RepID=A0AAD5CE19_AMBAR|nr:hypothetical protein M8C21_005969 [Ambrosia artemisiifolia]
MGSRHEDEENDGTSTSEVSLLIATDGRRHQGSNQSPSSATSVVVVFSTLVAVSGSYVFGCAIGFSSPAQTGIMDDLGLSLEEVAWLLDAGRLFIGYGIGVLSYVVPVYIAEITPQNLRGAFTTVNQAKIGLWEDCESALHRLRGKNAKIFEEATEIRLYTETLHQLSETRVFDLFQPEYAKSLIIGVGLMVLQQFGGVNAIAFYVDSIFISAGSIYLIRCTVDGYIRKTTTSDGTDCIRFSQD